MYDSNHALLHRTIEFVRHYPRQLITAEDLNDQVSYVREKLKRHNRMLHGYGIVCGLTFDSARKVIQRGYALSPCGNEIMVPEDVPFDPQLVARAPDTGGCPPPEEVDIPDERFLVVCYRECPTRPVRVHAAGCGCHDDACEYARTREWYELCLLDKRPHSHPVPVEGEGEGENTPVGCPPAPKDDCVLLGVFGPDGTFLGRRGVRTLALPAVTVSPE